MNTTTKIIGASLLAVLAGGILAGCGGDSTPQSNPTPQSSQETQQPEVNPGNSEGLSQMLPPVIVEENQTDVQVKVGDFLDIIVEDPVNTTIELTQPGVLSITQGYSDGSAVFNPGAQALTEGQTTIIIQNPDQTTRELVVTVE